MEPTSFVKDFSQEDKGSILGVDGGQWMVRPGPDRRKVYDTVVGCTVSTPGVLVSFRRIGAGSRKRKDREVGGGGGSNYVGRS